MKIICFVVLAWMSALNAEPRLLSLSLSQDLPAPRWMYDPAQKVKGSSIATTMMEAKKAFIDKRFGDCVQKINEVWAKAPSLHSWLVNQQMQCALEFARSPKQQIEPLNQAIVRLEQNREWLVVGPQSEILRDTYIEGLLLQIEKWAKTQRSRTWENIEKLQRVRSWMDRLQMARLYRTAGEVAFIEQKTVIAADFFQRSLEQKDSEDLRLKLESLKTNILKTPLPAPAKTSSITAAEQQDIAMSSEEKEIFTRMQQMLKSGDVVSAAEDGVKLLEKFPGSARSKWAADRMIESYLSIASKSDSQYRLIQQRLLAQMLKVDGGRMFDWAQTLFTRGYFADALDLAEQAMRLMKGHPDATKILRLASRAALFSGEYNTAVKYFEILAKEHSGTVESVESVFRLGLLYYRKAQYSEAQALFERLLILPGSDDFHYSGMYWQWRSQQKLNSPKAQETAQKLIDRFPLTYYGLRARAELNGNQLVWPLTAEQPAKVDVWLTDFERVTWEKVQILLKAGWFQEARAELMSWPPALSLPTQLLKVKLFATAFDYYTAIQLTSQIWEQNPQIIQPWNVQWVYPKEFTPWIERETKKLNLDPNLVWSLIRQESSFRRDVVSSAGASGLMQLVMPTAREIAKDLRIKTTIDSSESLFDPELNIRLGTVYFSRLLKTFKGNVPLALAAYNAGMGRVRKWASSRTDLGDIETQHSGTADSEIWIDELPWTETSFYVKAILRNYLIYKLLNGENKLSTPLWKKVE